MNTGLKQIDSVKDSLIVALDGNFQHRHQKAAVKSHMPLVTSDMFVQPTDLEDVLQYIARQEKIHKVWKKVIKHESEVMMCVTKQLTHIGNLQFCAARLIAAQNCTKQQTTLETNPRGSLATTQA
jgi:hypothetical protein